MALGLPSTLIDAYVPPRPRPISPNSATPLSNPTAPTIANLQRTQLSGSSGGSRRTPSPINQPLPVPPSNPTAPTIENARNLTGKSQPTSSQEAIPPGYMRTPGGYLRQIPRTGWQNVGAVLSAPWKGQSLSIGETRIPGLSAAVGLAEVGSVAYGGALLAGGSGAAAASTPALAGTAGKTGVSWWTLGAGALGGLGIASLLGLGGGKQQQSAAPNVNQNPTPVQTPTQNADPTTSPTQAPDASGGNSGDVVLDGQGNILYYLPNNSRTNYSSQATYSYNIPTQNSTQNTTTISEIPIDQTASQTGGNTLLYALLAVGAVLLLTRKSKR